MKDQQLRLVYFRIVEWFTSSVDLVSLWRGPALQALFTTSGTTIWTLNSGMQSHAYGEDDLREFHEKHIASCCMHQ